MTANEKAKRADTRAKTVVCMLERGRVDMMGSVDEKVKIRSYEESSQRSDQNKARK